MSMGSAKTQNVSLSLHKSKGTKCIRSILQCLESNNSAVQDFTISQANELQVLGFTIVSSDSEEMLTLLRKEAEKWEATISFETLKDSSMIKYIATISNESGLSNAFLQEWTNLLADHDISIAKAVRLSDKLMSFDFELEMPASVNLDAFRASIFTASAKHSTDIALQPDSVYRRNKRLVIFDMDSTLIQQEVIDEIAKRAGVVDKVAKITEAAMNGELDFKQSLAARVALLKGSDAIVLEEIKPTLQFTPGARVLCRALKKLGFKLAVISGGFLPLAVYVKNELGLDYAFANQLKVSPDGKTLLGETVGPIVDGIRKAELLDVIAQAESVTRDQVVAVGDGANDLWMLAAAGLGIAFNAKPRVQEKAQARINQKSLVNVLYLLGYTDEHLRELLEF